ncbi:GntR family transcriptional regulator [Sporolactobacillus sp. CQH2019]|uniref:GntR family transcriptional regulator n=1 Tax=Sporolactobacillus sp. CQH2019 TaxID=3023512 RepID=UPI002368960C|nr:GntR family transcriptional regulator [Sporolactobacillus sp. CQH2019]MDD9150029.1 GntR family transcriptional regulator [Sporolactobacillus sp. CQH2019]
MVQTELQHLKIAEYLINCINTGVYQEGDKIPSENELCSRFAAKRSVVRQAIARAANLGWLTSRQGKGSFVNKKPRPVSYSLSSQTRFSDNMDDQGIVHSCKLLNCMMRRSSETEKHYLQLENDPSVYELEILRFVNQCPISVTTTLLPAEKVPRLEQHLINFHSLYQVLSDFYHLMPRRSKSIFQAMLPDTRDAGLLDIPENVPIIRIESFVNHLKNHPIEYSNSRIRGDMEKGLITF